MLKQKTTINVKRKKIINNINHIKVMRWWRKTKRVKLLYNVSEFSGEADNFPLKHFPEREEDGINRKFRDQETTSEKQKYENTKI